MVPPIAKDGSTPADCSATVSIAVVVVLPCVPATATDVESDISQARAIARATIGSPLALAAISSGFFSPIAEEMIIRSASPKFFAS